jgi:hypothetical protein
MPEVTSADFGPVDYILSAQRGVRGWLDTQDKLHSRLQPQIVQMVAPTETQFDLAFSSALEAGKFATATEIKVREEHRQSLLAGTDPRERLSPSGAKFNEQAIRAAQRSLKIVRAVGERLDETGSPVSQLLRVHEDPEAKVAIEDGRAAFFQALVKFNGLPPEEFEEIQQIWAEVVPIATEQGVAGLLDYTQKNIEQFIEYRGSDDRGNRPHSPLPWWKWLLIAWLASSAVFCIIACFVWSGCSWVWGALGFMAGIVWQIIDRGC